MNICSDKSDIFEEKNTNKFIPIRSNCQTQLTYKSSFLDYKVPAEPDGEPVDDLDNRDKAVILGDLKKKLIVPIPMQREGYSGAR